LYKTADELRTLE